MTLSKTVRIRYVIDERRAARGLQNLKRGTDEVRASATKSTAAMGDLGKGASSADKGLISAGKGAAQFATGATAAAAAATATAAALVEMAERASQSEIAFQNLPFQIDSARTATRGLVDDLTLAQSAITSNRLGVTSTGVEFADLAETATKLGLSVGQDATKSVEDLTTALARQSPLILDNLGVTLKVSEANEEYAARLGKLATELTDAEKKQAFVTIGLERARDAAANVNIEIDETASLILELKTAATNFASDFSRDFLGAVTEGRNELRFLREEARRTAEELAQGFGQSQEDAKESVEDTTDALKEGTRSLAAQATLGTSEFIPFLLDWRANQKAINVLLGETNQLQNRGGVGGVTRSLNEAIDQLRTSNPDNTLNRLNSGLTSLSGAANRAQRELKAFFEEAEKNQRGRGGRSGRTDPFAAERAEFQRQLTDAINAERRREFGEAVTLQRTYLADVQRFESELAQARQPSIDRFALERERAEFLAEFQSNAAQRTLEVELARADSDAERFRLQQEAFDAKEAQLTREIELTNNLDERAQLQDERESVRHQATLSRIDEERRAREEYQQGVVNTINAVDAAQNGSFQLSSTIAAAAIKGEQRRKRVLDGIKAGELFTDGTVAAARAFGAGAAGNIPQAIALAAASANYFAQGAIVAAGNARGRGGSSSGPTAAGLSLSRGEQPQRQVFQVDRGAPISVREDIEGNPNNTSGSSSSANQTRSITIQRIDVLGAIDDESANKIKLGLQRAEANI